MTRKPSSNKLNKAAEVYFQCFLVLEVFDEVKLLAGTSSIAKKAGASRCKARDELEGIEAIMLKYMPLSKNITPLPYPNWYAVRYQDEGGKLMLTCLPLSEETAKSIKKDGRYVEELSKAQIAKVELLETEKARWNLCKGESAIWIVDTLLRGAELPKVFLDLTPTFNFIERKEEVEEEVVKDLVAATLVEVSKIKEDVITPTEQLVKAVKKFKEAPPTVVPSTATEHPVVLGIGKVKEILKEEGIITSDVTVIEEPKEEHPDLKGYNLTVSDHAIKRWLGRVRKDETTQINHKVRREMTREVGTHFRTSVKVFGEGINDERTSYFLDKDNIIYVFGEEEKSIITLYPISYGFDPSVDRIALLAQIRVIKDHYAKYHESQKSVRKKTEKTKAAKLELQVEIDLMEAQLAEMRAKKSELDAQLHLTSRESNTHLVRYTKEFNKVFRKNNAGVDYNG